MYRCKIYYIYIHVIYTWNIYATIHQSLSSNIIKYQSYSDPASSESMDGISSSSSVSTSEFSWIRMSFASRNAGTGAMLGLFWRLWILRPLGSSRWEGLLTTSDGEVKDLLESEVATRVCCSSKATVPGMLSRIYWNIHTLVEIDQLHSALKDQQICIQQLHWA